MKQTATLQALPSGKAGTLATLEHMRRLAADGKKSLSVRHVALSLVSDLPQKDYLAEVERITEFVRDGIRYTKDINGVETLQTPEVTLQNRTGDCDDKVTLLAALLETIGHPTRFVAVGFSPERYSHVYAETKVRGRWIPLETTEPVQVGWQPPRVVSMIRYPKVR